MVNPNVQGIPVPASLVDLAALQTANDNQSSPFEGPAANDGSAEASPPLRRKPWHQRLRAVGRDGAVDFGPTYERQEHWWLAGEHAGSGPRGWGRRVLLSQRRDQHPTAH